MIVVKIEIYPHGGENRAYEITRTYISNNLKTSLETNGEYGSYDAEFMQSIYFNPKKIWKKGQAAKIHRTKRGAWDILYSCLKSIGMEKRNRGE